MSVSPTCASRSCGARMWDDAHADERARAHARRSPRSRSSRGGAVAWLVRQPRVRVPRRGRHDAARARRAARTSKRSIREELAGTFFTLDLERARSALGERAVGARRRAAPAVAATGSKSTVEEHEPLARWNDAALVNTRGEVFAARLRRRAAAVRRSGRRARAEMAERYRAWSRGAARRLRCACARSARCRRAAAGAASGRAPTAR